MAWLRAIVDNGSGLRLGPIARWPGRRGGSAVEGTRGREQILAGHALRDGTWHAKREPSQPFRVAVILRGSSRIASGEKIASGAEAPPCVDGANDAMFPRSQAWGRWPSARTICPAFL